jgi:hypothetical protein
MEILRIAENISLNGIQVTAMIPGSSLQANGILSITDLSDLSVSTEEISFEGSSPITFYLSSQYDTEYLVELSKDGNVVFSETYQVVRPYVDPNTLGTTASEIAEYKRFEAIARAIIDNYSDPVNFYNRKRSLQTKGTGADYVPVWMNASSVLKVYENDVLIYDAENPEDYEYKFQITLDKSAIYRAESGEVSRIASPTIKLPASSGDIASGVYNYGSFPERYTYNFILDEGFVSLPADVKYAAEMLIDDLKCGKLDYYQRYVIAYNTDQFRIQFDKSILSGTGNVIVDKILDKYSKSITRVGVL